MDLIRIYLYIDIKMEIGGLLFSRTPPDSQAWIRTLTWGSYSNKIVYISIWFSDNCWFCEQTAASSSKTYFLNYSKTCFFNKLNLLLRLKVFSYQIPLITQLFMNLDKPKRQVSLFIWGFGRWFVGLFQRRFLDLACFGESLILRFRADIRKHSNILIIN